MDPVWTSSRDRTCILHNYGSSIFLYDWVSTRRSVSLTMGSDKYLKRKAGAKGNKKYVKLVRTITVYTS